MITKIEIYENDAKLISYLSRFDMGAHADVIEGDALLALRESGFYGNSNAATALESVGDEALLVEDFFEGEQRSLMYLSASEQDGGESLFPDNFRLTIVLTEI
jgi:hypothetical protein